MNTTKQGYCDVSLRLGRHSGLRRLSVRAELDASRVPAALKRTVWGAHALDEIVESYVGAVRDGVPKLQLAADSSAAHVVFASSVGQPATQVTMELALPSITRAELQPLVTMLRTGSIANGAVRVDIEEIGVTDTEDSDATWAPPQRLIEPDFEFQDNATGQLKKSAALHVVFERDLEDHARAELERRVGAWLRLVAAGAFLVPGEHTPSFALLEEMVDPYPDEWMAKLGMLAIGEDATALLLERLVDLHAKQPIARVELA